MIALLALTLQLQLAGPPAAPPSPVASPAASNRDSLRDLDRARDAQSGFERGRRYLLPWGYGNGGRCDVYIGRFCWWYEAQDEAPPPEPTEIAQRRAELLAELDTLGERHPGEPWIAGMRVYYRVDNRQPALADSAARACHAAAWWCSALSAYAAHARGDFAAADSGFATALAAMPDSTRCTWRNIATLLPGDARGRYEKASCAARAPTEARYWMLATPRLAVAANEWRTEFYARRVAATLLSSATTPYRLKWDHDTEELLLRYGWPVSWSRIAATGMTSLEPQILGHDPSPSFHFGPRETLLDSASSARHVEWELDDVRAESRYAHRALRRSVRVGAQLARFRRGDSTLVVAAWATDDDSLRTPGVILGVLSDDGPAIVRRGDSTRTGHLRLTVARSPRLAGLDLMDSTSGTFARARVLYASARDTSALSLSDLLLYRPADAASVARFDEAIASAIPGDTASTDRPLGLYWEAYTSDSVATTAETAVLVERIDHGFFRVARQRLGLADPDSPIRVRWTDARPASDGVIARALSLDLSTLAAGHYRISVSMTPTSGAASSTSTEIDLRNP